MTLNNNDTITAKFKNGKAITQGYYTSCDGEYDISENKINNILYPDNNE